jgi:HNH endonuclease
MKGRRKSYSAEELAWIEAHKELTRKDLHSKFCAEFSRSDVSFDNLKSLCTRKGWNTGRSGQFHAGSVSWNKGKKMPYNANSAKTRFQKGQLPANTKYLGHERISKDGYVEISVDIPNKHTGFERSYVHKHRHLWEKANGPIADDMCLKCLDGDKTNTNPSNWECIPRAMLPRLNGIWGRGYDAAEPEIKSLIMTITKLEHEARIKGSQS